MEENVYSYCVTFRFQEGLTREQVNEFIDELYVASTNGDPAEFELTREDGVYVLTVKDCIFEGNAFEEVLLNEKNLSLIQNTVYSCEGWGQRYFYRVYGGKLYDCETIQTPNGNWMEFDLLLKVRKEEDVNV